MVTTQLWAQALAADQSITSSTVLTTVTGFSFAIEANRNYAFDGCLYVNLAGVLSGVQAALSLPASPTNSNYHIELVNGSGLALAALGLAAAVNATLAATGLHLVRFGGVVENGVNAGNIAIQFAQKTSDSSAITAKRGSWFRVWNLS